jgi:hypothetical protein
VVRVRWSLEEAGMDMAHGARRRPQPPLRSELNQFRAETVLLFCRCKRVLCTVPDLFVCSSELVNYSWFCSIIFAASCVSLATPKLNWTWMDHRFSGWSTVVLSIIAHVRIPDTAASTPFFLIKYCRGSSPCDIVKKN